MIWSKNTSQPIDINGPSPLQSAPCPKETPSGFGCGERSARGATSEMMGSSLEDEDILKVLDRVRSGDRPPQRCLEEAQRLLLKKHDQLKRETMLLIEAAANIAGGGGGGGGGGGAPVSAERNVARSAEVASPELVAAGAEKREREGGGSGATEAATAAGPKKSTATILVSKNKAKLPLLLKIK